MVCPIPYGDHKKLKPGLVALYEIRPGNGEGIFWYRRFINLSLTYLDTHPLTYSLGPTWGLMARYSCQQSVSCVHQCDMTITLELNEL